MLIDLISEYFEDTIWSPEFLYEDIDEDNMEYLSHEVIDLIKYSVCLFNDDDNDNINDDYSNHNKLSSNKVDIEDLREDVDKDGNVVYY